MSHPFALSCRPSWVSGRSDDLADYAPLSKQEARHAPITGSLEVMAPVRPPGVENPTNRTVLGFPGLTSGGAGGGLRGHLRARRYGRPSPTPVLALSVAAFVPGQVHRVQGAVLVIEGQQMNCGTAGNRQN